MNKKVVLVGVSQFLFGGSVFASVPTQPPQVEARLVQFDAALESALEALDMTPISSLLSGHIGAEPTRCCC